MSSSSLFERGGATGNEDVGSDFGVLPAVVLVRSSACDCVGVQYIGYRLFRDRAADAGEKYTDGSPRAQSQRERNEWMDGLMTTIDG